MTEYYEIVEQCRSLLVEQKHNLPAMTHNVQDDFWLLTYPDGKIVKTYKDKRKKDEILQESYL